LPQVPDPTVDRSPSSRTRRLTLASLWLAAALAAFSPPSAAAPPAGPALATGSLTHGPFEIRAHERRVSTGTFPNQGGNPFARRSVSEFEVRWRGQAVATGQGQRRFWRVLRLDGAPRPALLLVTTGFTLLTEDDAGRLLLTPIHAENRSLAELQWLDAQDGQPAPSRSFGLEAVPDLQAGTALAGGRWLRLGSRSVMDVQTLAVHPVEPWVPMRPGVPITSLSRDGDDARAFSPRRTRYVLAASGPDYGREDRATAYGLLVVDIAQGTASELRLDRRRFRFTEVGDIDAAWVAHHFHWQDDAAGQEQLRPRETFAPWAWRARLWQSSPGQWQLDVPRIGAGFMPVLKSVVDNQAGVEWAIDPSAGADAGLRFRWHGCTLQAQAFGRDSRSADDQRVGLWSSSPASATEAAACESALRQLGAAVDAELASGRHDALLKLD